MPPLYVCTTPNHLEIRRVIPGQGEDTRLAASPHWQRIDDRQAARLSAGEPLNKVVTAKAHG